MYAMGEEQGGVPTDDQWFHLMDILASDHEMLTGQFTAPNGKQRLIRKWNEAAAELNQLGGAQKSGDKWKEAFCNMRARARKQYATRVAYMGATGGGEHPDAAGLGMNAVYARCVTLTGRVNAVGNLRVPDPILVSQQVNQNHQRSNSAPPCASHTSVVQNRYVSEHNNNSQSTSQVNPSPTPASMNTARRGWTEAAENARQVTETSVVPNRYVSEHNNNSQSTSQVNPSPTPASMNTARRGWTKAAENARQVTETSVGPNQNVPQYNNLQSTSQVNPPDFINAAKKGWAKAAENARQFTERQAQAKITFLLSDDEDEGMTSAAEDIYHANTDTEEPPSNYLTPKSKSSLQCKSTHTPPWDSPASRKRLSFPKSSQFNVSSAVDDAQKNFHSLAVTDEGTEDRNEACSQTVKDNVSQLKDAAVLLLKDSVDALIKAINANVEYFKSGSGFSFDQICTLLQSSQLALLQNSSALAEVKSALYNLVENTQTLTAMLESMKTPNVFVEGVNFTVVSEDENNE